LDELLKYLQYQVDYLNEGNLYTFTVETSDPEASLRYLQSVSKDVRFIKELEKRPKRASGTRKIILDNTLIMTIIDCHFRRDKISTFKAVKDSHSDDRYSLVENEESTYESYEDNAWITITRFQSIQAGDIIREVKNGFPGNPNRVLSAPAFSTDKFRVTVSEVKVLE